MLSLGSVKLLALGTAGAFFLGYCFYFDRRRTSAPDYKKKVFQRRQREAMAAKRRIRFRNEAQRTGAGGDVDDDQLEMQTRFLHEVQRGELLIKEGRVDEGLSHLCTAINLCANPGALLEMLEANLPEALFRPLMMRLSEMNQRESSSESTSETESTDQLSSSSATTSQPLALEPQWH
ncbi:mitochondrial import receptor subunit TOM20 homolog [Drosophila madeirensis]|uniref:Mitochondrial import receptor subunit TOM20 homolog n=1 Tax=Drosophila madeirensis TaxID=30013 RepID=A0AAU9EVF1_DROMD